MPVQHPPQLAMALEQVTMLFKEVEKRDVDLSKEPWPSIEKTVAKMFGGAFNPSQPAHQVIALGLTAALATRLIEENGAFWFLNRDTPEGVSLGFGEAVMTFGPFLAVADALRQAKLEKLDEIQKQIRDALAQIKFGANAQNRTKLRPQDYQRLFDPAFVQLLAVDETKKTEAFQKKPANLAVDLSEAITRSKLPDSLKKQIEQQLVETLRRLDPSKSFIEQARGEGERLAEVVTNLWAVKASTGAAPDEFFQEVMFPLLFIGNPQSFPPIEGDDLQALQQGGEPFFVFLEVVPFQYSTPPEEAVFGVFDSQHVKLVDDQLTGAVAPRMYSVNADILKDPLKNFSASALKATIEKFYTYAKEKEPKAVAAPTQEVQRLIDLAVTVINELKNVVDQHQAIYVRRMTEAEAQSEAAFEEIRKGLTGSRIILV